MPEVFGYCDANCKHPVYTKEQTLSILQQMIEGGSLAGINPDDSPVVALLREENKGENVGFWVGTEAEFNALEVTAKTMMCRIGTDGKLYLCTDDTTFADYLNYSVQQLTEAADKVVTAAIGGLQTDINNLDKAKQAQHLTRTVTLTAAGWSSGTQTVAVDGVTADNTVMVAAAAASMESYGNSKVKCTAQAAGKLTFTCDTENVPKVSLTVNISIWGV